MKKDVYQVITERIIALLEAGTIPWQRPWKDGTKAPQNFVSRKPYRGVNYFLLGSSGYPCPYWLTFRQVQSLSGNVRKGEKSFPVVFWKILEEEENGEKKKIPFLRYHAVFNASQCQGITLPEIPASKEFNPIEKCEKVMAEMQQPPKLTHGGEQACYKPDADEIRMPERNLFESEQAYYATLFHELTHATGHLSRLNRKEVADPCRFGSDPYAREELVAEMGAAFLCGHCQIDAKTTDQSAGYIEAWLGRLKEDRKLVVHAAAQAQKACDFVLGLKPEEPATVGYTPREFKVVPLRECAMPETMQHCEDPEAAVAYWQMHVASSPYFNPECECLVILLLNTRRRVKGHHLASIGILDSILVHPREIFRTAIVACASSIVMMHNHPSGESNPSAQDVHLTRQLIQAGKLLKVEVLDHIIVGHNQHCSLRGLGYF